LSERSLSLFHGERRVGCIEAEKGLPLLHELPFFDKNGGQNAARFRTKLGLF
jgi:hypothetical protein